MSTYWAPPCDSSWMDKPITDARDSLEYCHCSLCHYMRRYRGLISVAPYAVFVVWVASELGKARYHGFALCISHFCRLGNGDLCISHHPNLFSPFRLFTNSPVISEPVPPSHQNSDPFPDTHAHLTFFFNVLASSCLHTHPELMEQHYHLLGSFVCVYLIFIAFDLWFGLRQLNNHISHFSC